MKNIPKEVRVIDTTNIEFAGKDILYIKSWDDFLWLLGTGTVVHKLNNNYYIITEAVAYVYVKES